MPPETSGQMVACWARIRGRLRDEVGEVEYRTWLRQMTLQGIDGEEAVILLPTRFLRDWVNSHYGDRLRALWQAEDGAVRRVEIRVAQAATAQSAAQSANGQSATVEPVFAEGAASLRAEPAGLAESLAPPPRPPEFRTPEPRSDWVVPLEARFTFDAFVVGKPNEFAHACARRVAERPSSPGFNPLFLYGGVGLGKTHLMHAIAWELVAQRRHRGRPVRSPTCPPRSSCTASSPRIRSQSTMQFKEQLRSVDVLMIDDLQFLIGKDNTQEEFFHTFNALVDAGQADRGLRRQVALRPVGPRGPAAHPARLRHGGRPACHHLRAAASRSWRPRPRAPACGAGQGAGIPGAQDHHAMCASWKAR